MIMLQILGQIDPQNSNQEGLKELKKLLKDNGYLLVYDEQKTWIYIVKEEKGQ